MGLSDTVTIAPGVEMPRLGFGTYRVAPGRETERAVFEALEIGYRSVDTAALYGNEEGVGAAVRQSGLSRGDVFVATKVWNDDQGYRSTLAAFELSLSRLGFEYVDLYLVHWPMPARMQETWRAMEEILRSNRTRAIGVCNHLEHHLEALRSLGGMVPAVNQVEFHPSLQQPRLQKYCAEKGIALEAWAPLMRGRVAAIPEIVEIARAHGCSPVQVSLRWILQKGHIAIPKSVHVAHIRENSDLFGFELTTEEMAAIDALDANERIGPHPDRFT